MVQEAALGVASQAKGPGTTPVEAGRGMSSKGHRADWLWTHLDESAGLVPTSRLRLLTSDGVRRVTSIG